MTANDKALIDADKGSALLHIANKRKASGLTQSEFAQRLAAINPEGNWDQTKVSRYEKDERTIPLPAALTMLRALGEQEVEVPSAPLPGVGLEPPYVELQAHLSELRRSAESHAKTLGETLTQDIDQIVQRFQEKPVIAVFGQFDAGKTTVINTLLGRHSLPTAYQPQTQLITYIRHIDDRPSYLEDAEAIILGTGFEPSQWSDSEHLEQHMLQRGSMDILHREAGASVDDPEATALVFIDAPVLHACVLIDTPGSLEDIDLGVEQLPSTLPYDAAIICDSYISFLNSESITHVAAAHSSLQSRFEDPFDRLVVLATHAHNNLHDFHLSEIIRGGSLRAARHLAAALSEEQQEDLHSALQNVCLPFDPESSGRVAAFVEKLTAMLEKDGLLHRARVEALQTAFDSLRAQILATLKADLDAALKTGAEAGAEPTETVDEYAKKIDAMLSTALTEVERERKASRRATLQIAADHDEKAIEDLIRGRFTDKKDAKENAPAFVYARITGLVAADLQPRQERVSALLSDFLGKCDASLPRLTATGEFSTFDVKARLFGAAFGASVGLASTTALGMYAASLGNLGAYILVAKGVSILSGLGISVGGVSTAVTAIAAIGGPITLAVAGIAAAATFGFALVRGSWQKQLARDIRRRVVDEVLFQNKRSKQASSNPSLPAQVDKYWAEIRTSFEKAAEEAKAVYAETVGPQEPVDLEALNAHIARLSQAIEWVSKNITLTPAAD